MLVTGATGAVGRELLALARADGWDVTGIYHRNETRATALRDAWANAPGTLTMHACDLADADQIQALHDALTDVYRPDALVHLAAPPLDIRPIHRIPWDGYQQQFDGILKPLVLLARPLLKRMVRRGQGRIISVLSSVVLGTPPRGFASYTTAKYALSGYMKCLAAEYAGRGITANMVSPGPMQTAMVDALPALLSDQMRASIPGEQWIDPRSVAQTVFWLAAEAGPEITGCNIPVASGMTF